MAFDVTPGGAAANSFATVAEFKAYHATRYPQIEWIATAADALIEALLQMAARLLANDFDWTGTPADPASDDATAHQALCFPRLGMFSRNGFAIPSSGALSIPIDLKNAQCEWAGVLNVNDMLSDNDAEILGISSVKAGSVAVAFQNKDTSSSESVDMILRRMGSEFNYLSAEVPGEVRRLLVPSWFKQPTIVRPFMFSAFGGSSCP
jgi:hypothetical protein